MYRIIQNRDGEEQLVHGKGESINEALTDALTNALDRGKKIGGKTVSDRHERKAMIEYDTLLDGMLANDIVIEKGVKEVTKWEEVDM